MAKAKAKEVTPTTPGTDLTIYMSYEELERLMDIQEDMAEQLSEIKGTDIEATRLRSAAIRKCVNDYWERNFEK